MSISEPARMSLAQSCQQVSGVGVRVLFEPQQHIEPHALEGFLAGAPVGRVGARAPYAWAGLPPVAISWAGGPETAPGFHRKLLPESRVGISRCQCRLCLAGGPQQRHRVQLGTAFTHLFLRLSGDRVVLHQPVAGRCRRAVVLDRFGPVAHLLQQLEGGLEVIHIRTDGFVGVDHGLSGDASRVAVVASEASYN